jgi:morphogenetic protein associated with SpoVID
MVKSGDSMYTIAQKYGVKLDQLIAYNPQISNPDQIEVGTKVKIPSSVAHVGNPGVEYAHKHTVVQGDSLWKIAKAWGLPLKALVDANPQLKNPSVLLTGEIVNIPKPAHMTNPMTNPGISNTMNAAQTPNYTPILSNASNNISPANVPQPQIAPKPSIAPEQIIQPIPKPVEQVIQPEKQQPVEQVVQPEKQQPVEQVVLPEKQQPVEQVFQPEMQMPVFAETKKDFINAQPSESLFMQFDVPVVEAIGKAQDSPPSYQLPAWYDADVSQWEPTAAYATKPDCGCGCGGSANTMPYNPYSAPYSSMPTANTMPYNPYSAPYSSMSPADTMPYNPYSAPYSSMPTYYIPEPMLGYSVQEPMQMQQPVQTQHYPMQFPASEAPASPYGYMVPCYPMGAFGDMSYLHGMQTPYSSWINSNENTPPVQTLAESANTAALNEQAIGVLGTSDEDSMLKKGTKITRNPSNRSSQKQDDRALLHNFLRKKSLGKESVREYKLNEPWMNR